MAHYDDEEDRDEISTGEWVASTILAHLPLIGKTFKSSLHLGKLKCRLLYSFQLNIQLDAFAIHYTGCI